MPTKRDLQIVLKEKYRINLNITQSLSTEDCQELLELLQTNPSTSKLVQSFIAKNVELTRNNQTYGRQRSQAESKLYALQADHAKLQREIAELENQNKGLGNRKGQLSQEQQQLEAQIQSLSEQNQALSTRVQRLKARNEDLTTANQSLTKDKAELADANEILKRDNKALKNAVDQIRLKLYKDINQLLEYEDSEIRKALIRLFRWTLG
jgi:uncharacterized protein (DUF3084 family)